MTDTASDAIGFKQSYTIGLQTKTPPKRNRAKEVQTVLIRPKSPVLLKEKQMQTKVPFPPPPKVMKDKNIQKYAQKLITRGVLT